jgi:branched-chain amino acid transport system substrate-binding protein
MPLPGLSAWFPEAKASAPVGRLPGSLLGLALLALLAGVSSGGCPGRGHGPPLGELPLITSPNPKAEAELAAAAEQDRAGAAKAAIASYQAFLAAHPSDPLAPVAQLALGKLLLDAGDNAGARKLFDAVAGHPEPGLAERARFYGAVALQRLGDHAGALRGLEPMLGRTVDPADTQLLMTSLAAAQLGVENFVGAVRVLDQWAVDPQLPATEHQPVREQLQRTVDDRASPADIETLYRELPEEGPAWPMVVRRALRDADAASDADRVRHLVEVMQDHDIALTEELRALALRSAHPDEANPAVVGAVLSLSGPGRKVGEQALRGLMLAAGLPPQGPLAADAQQLVFRDDAGDPARAVEAIDELVSVHRAIAIVGPLDGQVAPAAAARAQELGVPLITLSAAGDPTSAGPMVFRWFSTPAVECQELIRAGRARGAQRFAVLRPEGAYGDAMHKAFAAELARQGAQEIADLAYPSNATSFGEVIARLAALEFDALFVADRASQLVLIAPALAAAGLWSLPDGAVVPKGGKALTLLVPSVGFDRSLPTRAGRYLQGALFAAAFDADTAGGPGRAFSEKFSAQYGSAPDAFAVFAHDAFQLVHAAVKAGATSRDTLAQALPGTRPKGLAGPSEGFGTDRNPAHGTRILELRGTAFVEP